jgi:threonine/homoserine/homoserine lactone efflux protein
MTELHPASPLWLYFVLVFGIIVLPGMDMAFVMASALVDGRRAGLAAVAGMVAGGMVHMLMGALGVGLLLLALPQLATALLLAGAAYVGWMGWSLFSGADALGAVGSGPSRPLWEIAGRALLTCLMNPKAYIFTLAVFPQFLRAEQGALAAQSLAMGAITALTQAGVYGAVALGAAGLAGWLRANGRAQIGLGRGVGLLLMATAAWTTFQGLRTLA